MIQLLVVGAGGFLGAIARYGLSGFVHSRYGGAFPAGTLIVNALGCLAIGVLMALVEDRNVVSPNVRLFLMIGLLGSMTTFSTFSYETLELVRDSSFRLATWNVLSNGILGLTAVWLGRLAVRAL